ncbi:hypothetical protein CDL62_14570 [Alkalitalea saponilacus]|nr:hypothetical protein CDL62_14570 [Alkalitalea saponilacus]
MESLLKKGNTIYVALPKISLTAKEKKSENLSQDLKDGILYRRKLTTSFLKTVGFVNALQSIAQWSFIDVICSSNCFIIINS